MRRLAFSLLMLAFTATMMSIARADDKALAAIVARHSAVQNLTVIFESTMLQTPPADAGNAQAHANLNLPPGVTVGPAIQGPESESDIFSFNSGSFLLDRRISPDTMKMQAQGGGRPLSRELLCVSPGRFEELNWCLGDGRPTSAGIAPPGDVTVRYEHWTVNLARAADVARRLPSGGRHIPNAGCAGRREHSHRHL